MLDGGIKRHLEMICSSPLVLTVEETGSQRQTLASQILSEFILNLRLELRLLKHTVELKKKLVAY